MTLPSLPPELILPVVMVPPLAWALASPPFPAAALPPAPPAPPVAVLLLPPLALAVAVPPSALMVTVVWLETVPPSTATLPWLPWTAIWLPSLPPELMLPVVIAPPLAVAVAVPAFPAAALPPLPPAPPAPPGAVLLLPPLALAVAVPPSALMVTVVWLETVPPSMATFPPWLPWTAIWLPLLPPELMLPTLTVPPLAVAVAGPPFPAAALPPAPPAPPAPPVAVLLLPPFALAVAVPPSALMATVVALLTVPPSTATLP